MGLVRLLRKLSAMTFGKKSCYSAKALKAARVSLLMRGLSLSARDTVATETPSSRAISFIVMGEDSFMVAHQLRDKVMQIYKKFQ